MSELSVALVGCGVMGRDLAKACVTLDQARLTAVSDVDEALVGKLGAEVSAAAYTDYSKMLDAAKPDAVIVAVPQFLHAKVTCAAAERGMHVFSEKPMAVTLDDCDSMIAACDKAGVNLMIGQVCRYHGVHRKVRDLVASGELGRAICMMVHRLGGPWEGIWARPWRMKLAQTGGGLLEVNCHEIDFMRFVCGDVASVHACGGTYVQTDADYPDNVVVSLRFESGAIGCLHGSQSSAVGAYGGRVDCTEGGLSFPTIWGDGSGITVGRFGGGSEFIAANGLVGEEPVRRELREFVESVLERRRPAITGQDGRAAVEIATAAYRSIETGGRVDLPL
ncbi:MAG: Gfo/Idh/MocA family oxidoreductase [Phycisphaerae bacterium]|nr:Gfo/Idh/MocA family oxidoreductase [Phycisphaerae bacterium]